MYFLSRSNLLYESLWKYNNSLMNLQHVVMDVQCPGSLYVHYWKELPSKVLIAQTMAAELVARSRSWPVPKFYHATYFMALSLQRLNTFINDLKCGSEITQPSRVEEEDEERENDSTSEKSNTPHVAYGRGQ